MKTKDYNEHLYTTLSLESDTEHRANTKFVYQFKNEGAEFIGDEGVGARFSGDEVIKDSLPILMNKYYDDDKVKLYTTSVDLSNHPSRDDLYKKMISKGKILISAFGNDNTGVFDQVKNENWITVLGVSKHRMNGNYLVRGYVDDDLSKINIKRTFAVDRSEEDITLHNWLKGTSFDQPYLSKIVEKICSYTKIKGHELQQNELIKILQYIGKKINIKGYNIYLISKNIDYDKLDEILEIIKVQDNNNSNIIKTGDDSMENKISEWAVEAWEWAVKEGLNDGEGAKNNITEEQMMVFLKRFHDKYIEKK